MTPRSILRRLPGAVRVLLAVVASASVFVAPASGQEPGDDGLVDRRFYVVEVDGPIDSLMQDQIVSVLAKADDPATSGIMLRFKKVPGSLGVDTAALAAAIRDAPVPVVAFVGPTGAAEVAGGGVLLLAASDVVVFASDTTVGPINPVDLLSGASLTEAEAAALLDELRPPRAEVAPWLAVLDTPAVVGEGGLEGVSDTQQPTVGEALLNVDGRAVVLPGGRVVQINTFEGGPTDAARGAEPELAVLVVFTPLGYVDGFLHKIHTPTYAYVMIGIALLAIAFEFFSVSVGIAGILGAVCLAIGFLAAGALPVHWWAIALLFVAVALFCIDVQQGTLGGFTVLGAVAMVVGSLLFTDSGVFRVHWWAIVLVVGGTLLFFAVAMTTVVRTRFATPTIGRQHLLDATGVVVSDLAPEGTIEIDGAVWKARAHRGRIDAGAPVRVRAIQGISLEVDPAQPASGTGTGDG